MNTDKIYTINDFLQIVVRYGKSIGLLVQFPSLFIPDDEKPLAYILRMKDKEYLRDRYKDIKFYIQNGIFTTGKVLDILHDSAVDTLPSVDDADYTNKDITRKEVEEHINLMIQQIDIVIIMILTNIMTNEDYPEKSVMRFIDLEE